MNQELKEELEESKRGEHVFNNDILRFHSKVLNKLIERHGINNFSGYNPDIMNTLGRHTLTKNTKTKIQKGMVAYFEIHDIYVNSNVILYSLFSSDLCAAFFNVLEHGHLGVPTEVVDQKLSLIIDGMNRFKIYVDELAREKWDNNKERKRRQVKEVKVEVVAMYSTGRGLPWCTDILREVSSLRGGP